MRASDFGKAPSRREIQPGGRVTAAESSAKFNQDRNALLSSYSPAGGRGGGEAGARATSFGATGAQGQRAADSIERARTLSTSQPQPPSLLAAPESRSQPVPRPRAASSAALPPRVSSPLANSSPPPPPKPSTSTSSSSSSSAKPAPTLFSSLWAKTSALVSGTPASDEEIPPVPGSPIVESSSKTPRFPRLSSDGLSKKALAEAQDADRALQASKITPFILDEEAAERARKLAEEEAKKPVLEQSNLMNSRPVSLPLASLAFSAGGVPLGKAKSDPTGRLPTIPQRPDSIKVEPITWHRPAPTHPRDFLTPRFKPAPKGARGPFDWLTPSDMSPVEPFIFLRAAGRAATRRPKGKVGVATDPGPRMGPPQPPTGPGMGMPPMGGMQMGPGGVNYSVMGGLAPQAPPEMRRFSLQDPGAVPPAYVPPFRSLNSTFNTDDISRPPTHYSPQGQPPPSQQQQHFAMQEAQRLAMAAHQQQDAANHYAQQQAAYQQQQQAYLAQFSQHQTYPPQLQHPPQPGVSAPPFPFPPPSLPQIPQPYHSPAYPIVPQPAFGMPAAPLDGAAVAFAAPTSLPGAPPAPGYGAWPGNAYPPASLSTSPSPMSPIPAPPPPTTANTAALPPPTAGYPFPPSHDPSSSLAPHPSPLPAYLPTGNVQAEMVPLPASPMVHPSTEALPSLASLGEPAGGDSGAPIQRNGGFAMTPAAAAAAAAASGTSSPLPNYTPSTLSYTDPVLLTVAPALAGPTTSGDVVADAEAAAAARASSSSPIPGYTSSSSPTFISSEGAAPEAPGMSLNDVVSASPLSVTPQPSLSVQPSLAPPTSSGSGFILTPPTPIHSSSSSGQYPAYPSSHPPIEEEGDNNDEEALDTAQQAGQRRLTSSAPPQLDMAPLSLDLEWSLPSFGAGLGLDMEFAEPGEGKGQEKEGLELMGRLGIGSAAVGGQGAGDMPLPERMGTPSFGRYSEEGASFPCPPPVSSWVLTFCCWVSESEEEDEVPQSAGPNLDEAFGAMTAFVQRFRQEDVPGYLPPPLDPEHGNRMDRWLSQQGIAPVSFAPLPSGAPRDEDADSNDADTGRGMDVRP